MENLNNENIGAIQEEALLIESERKLTRGGQSMTQEEIDEINEAEDKKIDSVTAESIIDEFEVAQSNPNIPQNEDINNLTSESQQSKPLYDKDFDPYAPIEEKPTEPSLYARLGAEVEKEESEKFEDGRHYVKLEDTGVTKYLGKNMESLDLKYTNNVVIKLFFNKDAGFEGYIKSTIKKLRAILAEYGEEFVASDLDNLNHYAEKLKKCLIGREVIIEQATNEQGFPQYKILSVLN